VKTEEQIEEEGGKEENEGECSRARGGGLYSWQSASRRIRTATDGAGGKIERETAMGEPLGDGMKLRASERHICLLRQPIVSTTLDSRKNLATHLGFCSCCAALVEPGRRMGNQCCRAACGPPQAVLPSGQRDSPVARGAPSRSNQRFPGSRSGSSKREAITPSTSANVQPPPHTPDGWHAGLGAVTCETHRHSEV